MSTPPRVKPGRNEPCWCGSGKKYKHCHLHEDEEAERAALPPPEPPEVLPTYPASPAWPPKPLPSTEPIPTPELSPEQIAAQAEWERFEKADLAGQVEIYRQGVQEKRLDKEDIFEMLLSIREQSNPAQNSQARTQFRALAEELQQALPEVYREDQGFLLDWLIRDAVADREWSRVADLLPRLSEVADERIDQFLGVVYMLVYHGQIRPLFQAMQAAWNKVSNSEEVTPYGVYEFQTVLITLNLLIYLETASNPRADDPALLEPIAGTGEYDLVWLNAALRHLAAPTPSPWQRQDFDDAVDAEAAERNLNALLFEFAAEAQRTAEAPLSRSYMMTQGLGEVLRGQWVTATMQNVPKGKHAAPRVQTHPLVPQYTPLDRALGKKFGLLGGKPYEAAAVLELLPAYLHWLAQLGLVHPTEMDEALAVLQPLVQPTLQALVNFAVDPFAVQNLENAWSESTLNRLRDDPALAEARATPLALPPPPSNPLANARTYRFKVTYLRGDDVWFIFELRRDQTLDDLHHAIQNATEFDNDHPYSFYLSGRAFDKETEYSAREARYSSATWLKNVPLRLKQHFLYLFDFGDQHRFDVQLLDVGHEAPKGKYPRLLEAHGQMPPQYEDWDEDEEEELEEGEDDN